MRRRHLESWVVRTIGLVHSRDHPQRIEADGNENGEAEQQHRMLTYDCGAARSAGHECYKQKEDKNLH